MRAPTRPNRSSRRRRCMGTVGIGALSRVTHGERPSVGPRRADACQRKLQVLREFGGVPRARRPAAGGAGIAHPGETGGASPCRHRASPRRGRGRAPPLHGQRRREVRHARPPPVWRLTRPSAVAPIRRSAIGVDSKLAEPPARRSAMDGDSNERSREGPHELRRGEATFGQVATGTRTNGMGCDRNRDVCGGRASAHRHVEHEPLRQGRQLHLPLAHAAGSAVGARLPRPRPARSQRSRGRRDRLRCPKWSAVRRSGHHCHPQRAAGVA